MNISLKCLILFVIASYSYPSITNAQAPEKLFYLAYKLEQPKTVEINDPSQAKAHLDALKSLGVTPKIESHDGHTDITYQQPRWTLVKVTEDKLIHQWEGWLTQAGFQVIHGDTEAHDDKEAHGDHKHAHGEVLEFRTIKPVVQQFGKDVDAALEFKTICMALGCEVQEQNQNGNAVVQVACPNWHHIECASHEDADAKQNWLKKLGFETKHED